MTQAMWIFIILCFLLPAATDLLFHNVSVCWLIGCTVVAMIWNFFCGCRQYSLSVCTVDAKSFYNTCLPKRNTICSLAACLNLHQLSDIYCVYKQVVKPDCEC